MQSARIQYRLIWCDEDHPHGLRIKPSFLMVERQGMAFVQDDIVLAGLIANARIQRLRDFGDASPSLNLWNHAA